MSEMVNDTLKIAGEGHDETRAEIVVEVVVIVIVIVAFGFIERVFMRIGDVGEENFARTFGSSIGVGRVDGVNADLDRIIGFHGINAG